MSFLKKIKIKKKKKVAIDLWQWHCRNRREKKLLQLVCGNGIAEIGEKFFFCNWFMAMTLPRKKKLFDFWQYHCRNNSKIICH